jgi:glycosyl transferase family 25
MVYLNNTFEVKVISRINSKRRNKIQQNLESKNIKFNFFDAIDKSTIKRDNKTFTSGDLKLELNTTMPFPDAFNNRGWMKVGEVGCFFSHYALWLELVNTNKAGYFILEDDADPQFTGKEIDIFLEKESLNGVDMIICQSVSPNFSKGKPTFKNITDKMDIRVQSGAFDWITTEGTTGYIITNSGAKKLIDIVQRYNMFNPVDNFIGRCVSSGLATYLCPKYLQVILNENVETEIHYDVPEQQVEYIENIKYIIG